jgi:ATPase family associated with various cellular activities (AAA)
MIDKKKLEFWINTKKNVLLIGKHGVGKTAIVKEAFTKKFGKMGEAWLYFSAATMDPWVDFIGVPREAKDENGEVFLQLVMPRVLRDDKIKAIFVDEFNRAPKKIRNALMELIQFKSINGRPFNNIEMIWAAINPHDENDTYDVDKLDPAQLDRFHIHYTVPYELDRSYLSATYGKAKAGVAINWWKQLPEEVKDLVSPRRVDYALEIFSQGGALRNDVLPAKSGVDVLLEKLNGLDRFSGLTKLVKEGNEAEIKAYLNEDANYAACVEYIVDSPEDYLRYVSMERLAALANKHRSIKTYIAEHKDEFENLPESCNTPDLLAQEENFYRDPNLRWDNYREISKQYFGRSMRFRRTEREISQNISPQDAFEARREAAMKSKDALKKYLAK